MPVILENDANTGALAEVWWGLTPHVSTMPHIKVATGVGAGIILNGELVAGMAGEIGHTVIDGTNPFAGVASPDATRIMAAVAQ